MAVQTISKIKPFKALRYNAEKFKYLADVVCPPYDVISPKRQQELLEKNPYNLIHILLSKDVPGQDKYEHAGACFREWFQKEIFIQEEEPAIFLYSQQYTIKGEKKTRVGFIGLLYLGSNKSSVFGHEHIRLEAKEDRLKLLEQVRANLSPIFVVFSDSKRIISRTADQVQRGAPYISLVDDEKVSHKLWKIVSPEMLAGIETAISGEDIFIADGHHRFEVASVYRDRMRNSSEYEGSAERLDYLLTYFTSTDTRNLSILPIHRLLKTLKGMDFGKFSGELKEFFDVEEVRDGSRFFFLLQKAGINERLIGMYRDKKFWLLRLKNIMLLEKIPGNKSREYKSLDVSILNQVVLKKILDVDTTDKAVLEFEHDAESLIEKADSNPEYTAFFLNPVKIEQITAVALNGERMPPKSTYFYPKVLSGLLINKL